MRKIILVVLFALFLSQNTIGAFAAEVKDEMYYKRQIQAQRLPYGPSGMVTAIQRKQPDMVQLFIDAGFSPDTKYSATPMTMYAIFLNDNESLKVLLKNGANPQARVPACFVATLPQNLLSFATQRKDSEAVAILIENKVDINKKINGNIPLNYAIKKKQTRIVELLLQAGAKPDEKTKKLVQKSKDEYLKSLFE